MTSKLRLSQRSNAEVSECSKGVWVTGGASCGTSCPDNHSGGRGEAGRAEERGERGGGGEGLCTHDNSVHISRVPRFSVFLFVHSLSPFLLLHPAGLDKKSVNDARNNLLL